MYLLPYLRTFLSTYVPSHFTKYLPNYLRTFLPTYTPSYLPIYVPGSGAFYKKNLNWNLLLDRDESDDSDERVGDDADEGRRVNDEVGRLAQFRRPDVEISQDDEAEEDRAADDGDDGVDADQKH